MEVGVGYSGEARKAPWPIVSTIVYGGRLEGQDTAPLTALRSQADVLVLFMDIPDAAWGVTYVDKDERPLGELSMEVLDKRSFALCMYAPLDSAQANGKPLNNWKRVFRRAGGFDAYAVPSKWGSRVFSEAINGPVTVLPHGFDPKIFYPMDRIEARRTFGISPTAFVMGYNAVNKQRKQVPAFFETAAKLLDRVPELIGEPSDPKLVLVFNGTKREDYYDIQALVDGYDLEQRGVVVYNHETGLTDDAVRAFYNALDIYTHLSGCEGFGLPIIEAQACRCVPIVQDYASMGELVPDAERGFLRVPVKSLIPHPRNALCYAWPDTDEAADRIAAFYHDKGLRVRLRKACFENSRAYLWERIGPRVEKWLEEAVQRRKDVSQIVQVEEV